jgi:gentisate 1,2-dioxygenase
LRPVSLPEALTATPLLAYRWVDTDRALAEQLALEAEGHVATLSPGHAAVRYTNPTTGRDVLPTIRAEMHRVRAGAQTQARREVGSSVVQVFDGAGSVTVGEKTWTVGRGDLFVVPSWTSFSATATDAASLDLFRFGDAPIFEALHAHRMQVVS